MFPTVILWLATHSQLDTFHVFSAPSTFKLNESLERQSHAAFHAGTEVQELVLLMLLLLLQPILLR